MSSHGGSKRALGTELGYADGHSSHGKHGGKQTLGVTLIRKGSIRQPQVGPHIGGPA